MRRFIVPLLLLLALVVGIAFWLRPARRQPAGSEPGVAAVPTLAPSSPPAGGRVGISFAWLGQRGVAGRRIAGRVVHAGQPVARAVVRLTTEELHIGEWPIAQVETDDAGRFDLGARPASRYKVVAQAEGLVAAGATVDLRELDPRPAPDALTIELRDCDLVVRGTVRDAAGGVIIGAHLRAGTYASEFGTTSSDEEGRYRLCVSAGPVHIEAGADGYGTALKHTRGRREVPLDFALVPEVVIAGRVVDGEGAPVGGAVVVAATNGHDPGVVAESAADGRFRLEGLVAGTYLVIARADDRAAEKSLNVAGGASADLVLTLEPRAPLAGRVMVGGRPAGGAKVMVSSVDGPWKLGSAVSQADGRFSITGLARGAVSVSVQGHKLVSPDPTLDLAVVHDVELVCERLATVSGRVIREGKPVGRAEVYLFKEMRRAHHNVLHDDGTFEIEGVAAGSYQIYAQSIAIGAITARRPLEVGTEDVSGLVLELDLAASIAGVVVDAKGAPVAGVAVHFIRAQDEGSDVTAADGSFLVTGLAGGGDYRAQVTASPDDYDLFRAPSGQRFPAVRVADGTSHVTGVRIAILRGDLTISGRVVRGGEPVAGVDVVATSEAGTARAQSGADGTFVIAGLATGRYRLFVERRGMLEAGSRVEAEAGAKDVRIELPPVGAIEGALRGFRTAPQITAMGSSGGSLPEADVTDTKFSIADVPVGTYTVHAVGKNGAHGSAVVTVAAHEVARVTIEAGKSAKVTGVVTDWRTGAPIAGAQCMWHVDGVGVDRAAQSDATGGFAFAVPARRVQIQCYAAYSIHAREVAVDLAPDGSAHVAVELVVQRKRSRYSPPGVHLQGADPSRVISLGAVAGASGLRIGDIVLHVDGRSVADLAPDAVSFLIADHDASTPASITVDRDGAELSFDVAPEAPMREPD